MECYKTLYINGKIIQLHFSIKQIKIGETILHSLAWNYVKMLTWRVFAETVTYYPQGWSYCCAIYNHPSLPSYIIPTSHNHPSLILIIFIIKHYLCSLHYFTQFTVHWVEHILQPFLVQHLFLPLIIYLLCLYKIIKLLNIVSYNTWHLSVTMLAITYLLEAQLLTRDGVTQF